jgi:hypothetical protein
MPRGEANAAKERCPQGHPLAGENLRISKRAGGERRVCRQCVREDSAARYAARKRAGR